MTAAVEPWTPLPGSVWRALRTFVEPYVGARFVVPGEPVPKGRPRLGQGRVITPKRTLAAEKRVREAFREAMPGWQPEPDLTYGVMVQFRTSAGSGVDVSNAVKLVEDALNKVFWEDDIQVGMLMLDLVRGRGEPGTEVWLYAIEPNGTKPTRVCECGTRYRSDRKSCSDCEKKRRIVNQLIAGDDAAATAADLLDRDRRAVFSYVTAATIGGRQSPGVALIARYISNVRGEPISQDRVRTVIATLISDGNFARKGRRLIVVKPLGAAA